MRTRSGQVHDAVMVRPVALALGVLLALGACVAPEAADGPATPPIERPEPTPAPAPEPEPEPEPAPAPEPDPEQEPEPEPEPAPEPVPVPPGGAELTIRVLDVGQGDALLLTHPDVTVLVDTGRYDRDDVVPLLRRLGVDRLDVLRSCIRFGDGRDRDRRPL